MQQWSAEQLELRRQLPVVVGNADYRENERRLYRMDELLRSTGIEQSFVQEAVALWQQRGQEAAKKDGRAFVSPRARRCATAQSCAVAHCGAIWLGN